MCNHFILLQFLSADFPLCWGVVHWLSMVRLATSAPWNYHLHWIPLRWWRWQLSRVVQASNLGSVSLQEEGVRKKREYRKRKHKPVIQPTVPSLQASHYHDIDVIHPEPYSSDEDGYSPVRVVEYSCCILKMNCTAYGFYKYSKLIFKKFMQYFQGTSPSDHEDENDPDGQFAFRRRRNCNYFAVCTHLFFGSSIPLHYTRW